MNAVTTYRPGAHALRPQTMSELMTFAQTIARSSLMPKDYINRPENVLVAIQMGSEIGLAPMQALQNIAVISGRPSVWGDAMLALVRASGLCEWVRETFDGETAVCSTKRRDDPNIVTVRFGDEDAKAAGLAGKPGPWQQYKRRMKQMRARGFCLRDAYPDVLKGIISAEEAQDIPADDPRTIDVPAARVDVAPQSTAEYLGDALPADEPPPSPDPVREVRKRLDACQTLDDVRRVDAGWQKACAKKQPPAVLAETVRDMIAERAAQLEPQDRDDLGDALADDDLPIVGEEKLDAG